MELEQRVRTLEYEMKLLKNEIQRTLLEIHEQVLIHYYPSLRSEDSTPTGNIVKAIEPPRVMPVVEVKEDSALIRTVKADDLPIVRKVSLEEVRALEGGEEQEPTVPFSPPVKIGKLMEWGLNSAAQIGSQQTTKVVELFSSKGLIDPNTRDVLLQVSPLNRRAPPAELSIGDILRVVLKLNELLNRETDIEETLAMIQEASIG